MSGDKELPEAANLVYQCSEGQSPIYQAMYEQALVYDQLGDTKNRDCYLQALIKLPEVKYQASPVQSLPPEYRGRDGNSIQDLRLSLKGDRFGQAIKSGIITTLEDAQQWLKHHLT